MKAKKNPLKCNRYEILWNLINSILAGLLVLGGSLTNGIPSRNSFFAASVAALIVFVTRFKEYWDSQGSEYRSMALRFLG